MPLKAEVLVIVKHTVYFYCVIFRCSVCGC